MGEKLFPPPGVMFFSVGEGATEDVVGVVVVDGLGSSLVPQPAVSALTTHKAQAQQRKAIRRQLIGTSSRGSKTGRELRPTTHR